jgi:transposase
MRPYSQDLRERIVQALEVQEESQAEIAERFAVSLPFVEQLWRRWRTTGSCAPRPHGGGASAVCAAPRRSFVLNLPTIPP